MEDVARIVETFNKLVEERGLGSANRYLLAVVDKVLHEVLAGTLGVEECSQLAAGLRDALIEYADTVNPFIMSLLGAMEEGFEEESVEEVLDKAWRLWREGRLDKLEV